MPLFATQRIQGVAIVVKQVVALPAQQCRPAVAHGERTGLLPGRARALVRRLQQELVGELLDIVAVAHPVAAQDVAGVPEFLDEAGRVHCPPVVQSVACLTRPLPKQQPIDEGREIAEALCFNLTLLKREQKACGFPMVLLRHRKIEELFDVIRKNMDLPRAGVL